MTRADRGEVLAAIKGARQRAGLTQEEAAARSGQHFTTVSRWETGKAAPQSWEDLSAYAHALGQPITLHFGPKTEEPQLITEVRAIRTVVDALAENQAAAIVSLGEVLRRLTPLADDPAGDQESQRRSDRPDR